MTEPVTVPATDGYPLAGNVFEPSTGAPHAAVVFAPAMGVPRRFYAPFSRYLAESGFAVVTFDFRGIGGSRPTSLRGFDATLLHWGERDLAGAIRWTAERQPDVPLLLVGHSIGGQIVGLTSESDRLDGMLTVASQSGYWRNWPLLLQPPMAFLWWFLLPTVTTLVGYAPQRRLGFGEDLPLGVALEWARWGRHPDYIRGWHGARPGTRFRPFGRPARAYAISDDRYAPRATVEALLGFYGLGPEAIRDITPKELGVPRIGHFGFFRDRFRDTLWSDAATWLHAVPRRRTASPTEKVTPARSR